jgi:hypothetical protein
LLELLLKSAEEDLAAANITDEHIEEELEEVLEE